MTAHEFDVVVVPDFSGPAARRFEIMTLLFLASWLEFGDRSRALPLHIACIGEAPESVRLLGARCGARISSHAPFLFGGFANKLRGFEVERQTDHLLLLDCDILVLSEINGLPGELGDDCIAAAVAGGPCIVPPDQWHSIHEMLGVPYPQDHVVPLNIELDTFQCAPYRDRWEFPPYYNGGVVYAPWRCQLGEVWRDHLPRVSAVAKRKAKISNQPSLATAIVYLQSQGVEFQILPDEYNVRWQHISAGRVSTRNTRLLHTIGFGRSKNGRESGTVEEEIDDYLAGTLKVTKRHWSHRGAFSRIAHYATRGPQVRDCYRVHELMKVLYHGYVLELVR